MSDARGIRPLPARPLAARRAPLGAGDRLAREGEAPGARQDARSARRSGARTSAAAATGDAASEFSAVVERYPANDYAHFCLGPLAGEARRPPRGQPAPVAGLRHAPDRTDYRAVPADQRLNALHASEGAHPAGELGVGVGRRRGRRRDRRRAGGAARASGEGDARGPGRRSSPTRSRGCACSTTSAGRMDRSLLDLGGAALCISQFTLYGDTRRGLRPSFTEAAEPADGEAPLRAVLPRAGGARGAPWRTGRLRRADVGRPGQRGPRDAAAGSLIGAPESGSCAAAILLSSDLPGDLRLPGRDFEVGLRPLFLRHLEQG